jgi:Ser/Thr protein kinase RdoA (MazF antagonist)
VSATTPGQGASDEAVDPLPADLVRDAVARFGLPGAARVEFLRHGENTTYGVAAPDGRRFALRINRLGYQTPDAIRSEIEWMESLRRGGVRTPVAIVGRDDDPLQLATGADGTSRTAVLFEWIDGVPLSAVGSVEPWERLGALMARIHELTLAWTPPAWFIRPAWDAEALVGDQPRWGPPDPDGLFATEDRALLEACRAEVRRRLDAIGTAPDRFGLIHGDLAFDNVLVAEDGEVVIIDFDDSGASWHLHELAVVLYPHDRSDGFRERRDALVDGYTGVRQLKDEWLSELPTFLMARRIQTLGWMFSRADTVHAHTQRAPRQASTPQAARDYLAWANEHPV